MRILHNVAGLVGTSWMAGAIVEDAGNVFFALRNARKINGVKLEITWSDGGFLPTFYRTRLDVDSTADALGIERKGGVVSADAIGGYSAVDWKRKARKGEMGWTLADLVSRKAITQAQADKLVAYYADETVEAAA